MEDKTKCLIKSREGCILHDETAITIATGAALAVGLFIAGGTLLSQLVPKIER